MIIDGRVYGLPLVDYADTQANIEALTLTASDEGARAFATDLDLIGYYDGSAWQWLGAADGITRTVGAAKDHTTIQAAVDWFKSKIITGACKIDVDAGTYDEAVVFDDLFIGADGSLELEGDTRVLAGLSYVDGASCNQAGLANGGSGACTLANAGTDITVTGAGGNPDFDADGWGSGDKLLTYDNAGTVAEYTIDSVLNNVITLTAAAPAVGNDATAICLLPDRRIERTSAGPCITIDTSGVLVDGFYLEPSTGADCNGVQAIGNAVSVELENVAVLAEDYGIYADNGGLIVGNTGALSVWDCNTGAMFTHSSIGRLQYIVAVGCTYGVYSATFSVVRCFYAIGVNATIALYAQNFSHLLPLYGTARQNTTGYYAAYGAYIRADSSNANNNGNGTDYNPAPGAFPGSAQGNNYATIYAS